jgi:predicted nucleic acid-binding protein
VSLVLDSSVALAWVYNDQAGDAVHSVFESVRDGGAWVPGLWKLEVANVLEMGVRRGRNSAGFRQRTLADLDLLPIQIDPGTDKRAWSETLQLADRHRLTLYDAAYLELAQRRGLPLATLDRELEAGAVAEGIPLALR